MKTYKNLYPKVYSYKNLERAFKKARKGKRTKFYVIEFEKNLNENLLKLKRELEFETYIPKKLVRFTIRDPKTRTIRKSFFKDRIVHHAIVNILEPIYEKIFIVDNYANRKEKGTMPALKRYDKFKRKVSKNGKCVSHAFNKNSIKGYVLRADIRKFFDSVDQSRLIEILKDKIKDDKLIWLIVKILKNFDNKKVGMPLGNMTSQFFANVYLNKLDYFVKHRLKAKYYLRYVDDFLILHKEKEKLEKYKEKIKIYLKYLKLELHPEKSKIFSLYRGVDFLGFRIFYFFKLVRKRNLIHFNKRLNKLIRENNEGEITFEKFSESINGWFAYIMWANTYKLRKKLIKDIKKKTSR